jgi:Flp pilus assembly protein TadG
MCAHTLLSKNAPAGRPSAERARRTSSRLRRLTRRLARSERGAVLVEFGLVAPIMALMTCAIIDFSMFMFRLNNLRMAVREGARYAAVLNPIVVNDARVVQRVRDRIVINGASAPVTVALENAALPYGNITVTITNSPYTPFTPMASQFGMGVVPMRSFAVFRSEFSND